MFNPDLLGFNLERIQAFYEVYYDKKRTIKITHAIPGKLSVGEIWFIYLRENFSKWTLRYAGNIPDMDFGIKILENIK